MKHVVTDDARVKGRMVSVAPEVSGVVRVLQIEEGHPVQAGQVLLELHDSSYRLQYEEAQAQAQMIQGELQEAQQTYKLQGKRAVSQIARAQAEVAVQQSALEEERTALALERVQLHNQLAEAEAAFKQAEAEAKEMQVRVRVALSNWERAQALFADGIVSVESRDQAQETLAQTQARLTSVQEQVAQQRARLNNALASQKQIQLRERKVQTMEAEVEKARANLRLA
jgi:membrane fusion protein, multidrug efflux system